MLPFAAFLKVTLAVTCCRRPRRMRSNSPAAAPAGADAALCNDLQHCNTNSSAAAATGERCSTLQRFAALKNGFVSRRRRQGPMQHFAAICST
jgi:hypothetical protein